MAIKEINSETFESEVMGSSKPVLVDFWAPWCMPCRMQAPILEELDAENGDFLICKVNVDENPELAKKFGISGIPTLIVMKDGQVKIKKEGVQSKQILSDLLIDI